MEPIKILVADDEALARQRIVSFLESYDIQFDVLEASTGKETIEMLVEVKPSLLFLDIKMTDMNGFEVLEQVPDTCIPIVIFVTAFDDFAVKAFEVQAIDFLLKPYKKLRLSESLKRGLQQLELNNQDSFRTKITQLAAHYAAFNTPALDPNQTYFSKVVLKSNKKYIFVAVSSITYIRSSGYYAEIFTTTKQKHLYRISMTQFAQKLDPSVFSRVNRSAIINREYVKEVISEGMGDFSVIMKDQSSFSVSKGYKGTFLKQMGIK